MENIYADIAARTGGNIYIGIVGPVRTGKSTLVKRIMEQLVIPKIDNIYQKERATDELPQSGSGKTIMTSEPKFVPEEAAEISPDGKAKLRIRMIDSVGYMVDGAMGATEDGVPRMVTTPWYDYEIPMTQAAELGTKKVMEEHCSIGMVVTTDGSITDIPRNDYEKAEAQAIRDMIATGKPFLVIINTKDPNSHAARSLKTQLDATYGIDAHIADCQTLDISDINELLRRLLYTFPMGALHVHLPRWVDALEEDHPVKESLYQALLTAARNITSLSAAENAISQLSQCEQINDAFLDSIDLGSGIIHCSIMLPESLFYQILSAKAGTTIENNGQLLSLLSTLSAIKKEYDKLSDAISSVNATGYGIVMPSADEMNLETPELIHKNGTYGIKLRAGAPSIHMIRVDIDTEITPMVGDEKQSRDLMEHFNQESEDALWQSNIFGKSVYEMIREGINTKLVGTPDDVRGKLRGALTKIVNSGANGLICLIL